MGCMRSAPGTHPMPRLFQFTPNTPPPRHTLFALDTFWWHILLMLGKGGASHLLVEQKGVKVRSLHLGSQMQEKQRPWPASSRMSGWWQWWMEVLSEGAQDPEAFPRQKGLCAPCQLVLLRLILLESKLARENGKTHLRDKSTSVPNFCFGCSALWSAFARDYVAMTYCCVFPWVKWWGML